MQKTPTLNYFDNHLGTKEKGREKIRTCVSVAISIQTVLSQNITQKNGWESGRFCNTGAICVLLKTLQSHQENTFSASCNVSCHPHGETSVEQ